MPLSSARRVVLLSYNEVTKTIEWRHYLISVRPVGVSKPIRKIIAGSTSAAASLKRSRADDSASEAEDVDEPEARIEKTGTKGKAVVDLSRADDISDYILRHEGMGYLTSDSEMSDASSAASGGSSGAPCLRTPTRISILTHSVLPQTTNAGARSVLEPTTSDEGTAGEASRAKSAPSVSSSSVPGSSSDS